MNESDVDVEINIEMAIRKKVDVKGGLAVGLIIEIDDVDLYYDG